jgi:hypothetical protein
MKFLEFLNDKEKIIDVPVEKELDVPRLKFELTFVGKRDEVEIYTEISDAPVSYRGIVCRQEELLIKEYAMLMDSLKRYELDSNKKVLMKDYFTLAKIELKDVSVIRKTVTIYEQRVVRT